MIRIALTAVAGLTLCATAVPHASATPSATASHASATVPSPAVPSAAAPVPANDMPAAAPTNRTPDITPTPTNRPSAAGDLLYVRFDDGNGVVSDRALRCHPVEGSLTEAADVAAACRRLDELGGPVGPVPRGQMCSMIWGGPQTARVTGTWRGRPVDESYSRGNGCQTARWQRMVPVLPGTVTRGPVR